MSKVQSINAAKILVVDDDSAQITIVTEALKSEGFRIETAEDGESALAIVEDWNPDLVLLDINLPGIDGFETLKQIRSFHDYTSVVFVSGKSDVEDVIGGLDAGADDYICKPFNVLELLARVRALLRIKLLQDQLENANKKLKELVDIDDLTGLFNMRSLYEKLDSELARGRRFGRQVAVVMMDMDHFKSVNDTNDHLFGSYVLSEVGKIIKKTVRQIDFAARYGGDEFLIVLTEISLEGAKSFCERLRKSIEAYDFTNDGSSMKLTSSIGFAITEPAVGDIDARGLVKVADRALYDAKEKGRNCYSFYDLGSDDKISLPKSS